MTEPFDDEVYICEVDAPPTAYFEIPVMTDDIAMNPPGRLAAVLRFEHHTLIVRGPVLRAKQVEEVHKGLVEQVRTELIRVAREAGIDGGIIWWRTRPRETEQDDNVSWFGRLSTQPPLPTAFWKTLDTERTLDGYTRHVKRVEAA